jgi:hypothetical protein
MSTLLNDNDLALQAAPYRDKTSLVTVTASATNFITVKNGGATTPSSITLTATPNIVFSGAAAFTWSYALNTAPTTWKAFDGALVQGSTTFTGSGTSIARAGTYTNLVPLSTSGTGSGAKFVVTKLNSNTSYAGNISVTVVNPGVGYKTGDTITISGGFLGGSLGTNNLTLTIGGTVSTETGTNTKAITAATVNSIVGETKATSIQFRCAVSENFIDTAYGYALVSYSLEQANADSITIELTRMSAVVDTTTAGVPNNFNNTGTTITVARSGAQLAYSVAGGNLVGVSVPNSFSVEIVTDTSIDSSVPNRTVGDTSYTANSWSLSGVTSLTADAATVTFLVTVYDASGYKTQSTYKTLSLTKVASGVDGDPALVYFIDLSTPVITKSTASKFIIGTHTQLTVYGKKQLGTATPTIYGFLTVTGDLETEATTAFASSANGYTTTIPNTSQNGIYTIRMYNMADRTNPAAVLLDLQTVPVVYNGSHAITATISNDSAPVSVNYAGTVISGGYAGTGTLIRVYEGADELTFDTVGSNKGTYNVTSQSSSLYPGTISRAANAIYASASNVSGLTADQTTVTFTITGTNKSGTTFTTTKLQSIYKSYPGADALLYYLDLSQTVITKNADKPTTDGSHSVVVVTGKKVLGNSAPITTGYVTFSPIIPVLSVNNNSIFLAGVSTLSVNDSAIFSGIGLPPQITVGNTYYIKTIDGTARSVTLSTSPGGAVLNLTNTSSITTAYIRVESTLATANTIVSTIPNDAGVYGYIARMYDTANKATLLDYEEIPVIFKGSNSVTMLLTNDSAHISCDYLGNPNTGGYGNTSTKIQVFDGTTELVYNAVGTTDGTYKVTATGTSITPGAITATGNAALTANASAITNALASITFTVTGKALNGNSINISKVQTLIKQINGKDGDNGITYKTAIVTASGWSSSTTPPALTGTFNYNWGTKAVTAGTGSATAYPSGWYENAPPSTANNQTLHNVIVTINAPSTDAITYNIPWSSGKTNAIGYREDGSIGSVGDSARKAYIVTTSASPPGTPTAGYGDSVPTSSAGTWSFNATSVLAAGEFLYQCDGTYKPLPSPGTTTWRAPYLSNLKVGNLSAISANLGYITAGSLNIGDGKFTVDTSGNVKIKGTGTARMEISNETIKVYDTSGALRVQLGNLDA